MLSWRAEPGGDQQGTELVAVQADCMRFVVQPRAADMGGRGMQPTGDSSAGAAPVFQVTGEPLDVGPAYGEQRYGAGAAPCGELAQVQRVRLPGQSVSPQYPARNPARTSRSASVKTRRTGTSSVDGVVVVMGCLPGPG